MVYEYIVFYIKKKKLIFFIYVVLDNYINKGVLQKNFWPPRCCGFCRTELDFHFT